MSNPFREFGESAKELSRNPLGIIALFIVLVYGFACLLFGFSAKDLSANERMPLIWFTPIFPILVLILFAWLVAKHHDKLYSPRDYRTDEAFLKTFQQKHQDKSSKSEESERDIKDLMDYGKEFTIITEQEKRIEADLKTKKLDFSDNTARVLIHHLAACQVLNWFEKIYNTLFGSQITLLRLLNEDSAGVSYDVALKYFEGIKSRYPKTLDPWSLDEYLKFMVTAGLITQSGGRIVITTTGKEFLIWLSKSGYSENKVL